MTDAEIIKKIIQGDSRAYQLLVEKYQALVFRTCMGFVHQKEEAEDLTQDVFVKAYQSLSSYRAEAAFTTWIYRIAVNMALNYTRKNKKNLLAEFSSLFQRSGKAENLPELFTDSEHPEAILIQEEHRSWFQRALDKLPESQRTALILMKYDDLSQKEVAQIMNITEGAVEALIQRGKVNLRNYFSTFSKDTHA